MSGLFHSNQSDIYLFQKDSYGRYVGCNERFAHMAGLSSPKEIRGLSDEDFPWQEQTPFFREVLRYVLAGNPWINQLQDLSAKNENHRIRISILPTVDTSGKAAGITASFVEANATGFENATQNAFLQLTKNERRLVRVLLSGKSNELIGKELCLSKRTIDGYVEVIKDKFCCASKTELIAFLYSSGLAYLV